MKNIILLSAVLFALSQVNILVEADQAMYLDGMYVIMGATPDIQKLIGLHLAFVPFTLAAMAIICVLFAYLMEYIEK